MLKEKSLAKGLTLQKAMDVFWALIACNLTHACCGKRVDIRCARKVAQLLADSLLDTEVRP